MKSVTRLARSYSTTVSSQIDYSSSFFFSYFFLALFFHNFRTTQRFFIILEDVGDKFYIVLSGEVMIELPDPEIPKDEFYVRYEEYKLLLKEM